MNQGLPGPLNCGKRRRLSGEASPAACKTPGCPPKNKGGPGIPQGHPKQEEEWVWGQGAPVHVPSPTQDTLFLSVATVPRMWPLPLLGP